MENEKSRSLVYSIYLYLIKSLGPQGWWPAKTPLEMVIGAILTQNTAWTNVEKAIRNLKRKRWINAAVLHKRSHSELAQTIRPSGYFNIKSVRLKNFVQILMDQFKGRIERMFALSLPELRDLLLSIWGIGAETADSIILYGARKKIFVVDAYTRRIFSRHGFFPEEHSYEEVQNFFHQSLPKKLKIFNEYHALIVNIGKNFCRKVPLCHLCPLNQPKFYVDSLH